MSRCGFDVEINKDERVGYVLQLSYTLLNGTSHTTVYVSVVVIY